MIKNNMFEELLVRTGMIHWRMPVDESNSLEHRLLKKPITKKHVLYETDTSVWNYEGIGTLCFTEQKEVLLESPSRTNHWPAGSPEDGDYCSFGSLKANLVPQKQNWTDYNRLHFKVYADCPGMHSPMIALQLYNDGVEKIPDKYCREGYHTIHLKNQQWNECVWEFPSLPRDNVTKLSFELHSYGKELSMSDHMRISLKDIYLELTPCPDHTLGWNCDDNVVAYSTVGYWNEGLKTAISSLKAESFSICDAKNNLPVFTGKPTLLKNNKGTFYIWDFTACVEEGTYYLKTEHYASKPFEISSHPLYESVWKAINFLYCERCGHPIGGGHGTCHSDIIAKHNNKMLIYNGGWHDAGDVSQQTLQTAEVVHSLLEMAKTVQEIEPFLYYRIMEEAAWGLDFILRMRFEDGYRASSAGICRWSNGLIGDMDDCEARVHNHAFENFLMAGVEAYAAKMFQNLDPELSQKSYCSACEDYQWALSRFELKGMELPIFFEHSYSSPLSLYWAVASWAASQLYAFGNDTSFANHATHFASLMLSCQETSSTDSPMSGFFYREPDKKVIVHFNHQSREQLYMQALEALCLTQPDHPERSHWESAMLLYGNYIKEIYQFSIPYSMLPAGIHKMDEYLDKETFPLLHLMTSFEDDSLNYKEQLEQGVKLSEHYCLRFFPIWFSFRGNTAIHLTSGKAASILGNYFKDSSLLQIAKEQLYWTFGKNPFGQSLVYGAGSNYAQQYGALNGEMVGSIPVGIETRGNEDIPFWPMENNATYKEVWTTSVGRWLWLAADLY